MAAVVVVVVVVVAVVAVADRGDRQTGPNFLRPLKNAARANLGLCFAASVRAPPPPPPPDVAAAGGAGVYPTPIPPPLRRPAKMIDTDTKLRTWFSNTSW